VSSGDETSAEMELEASEIDAVAETADNGEEVALAGLGATDWASR
jgi:hypothetical protein